MKENRHTTPWQQEPDAESLQEMSNIVGQAYKQAETDMKDFDIDAAWRKFDALHHVTPRPSLWRRWGVAASVALVCFVAVALSVPALRQLWSSVEFPEESEAPTIVITEEEEAIEETSEAITYRNVPLSQIVAQLATRYNVPVGNFAAEDIRLYVIMERAWSLEECITFLNHFEQVNITLTHDNQIEVR